MATEPTVGTQGEQDNWRGVIRHGRTVVWCCGHRHQNRDNSSLYNFSARDCAKDALWAATATPEEVATRQRHANMSRYARVATIRIETALARVGEVRAALNAKVTP